MATYSRFMHTQRAFMFAERLSLMNVSCEGAWHGRNTFVHVVAGRGCSNQSEASISWQTPARCFEVVSASAGALNFSRLSRQVGRK
jgi:hypothetical protein